MEQLPESIRELFWEGLGEPLDPEQHAEYIAIRVLERGDEPAVRWLLDRYGRERVASIVESGRLRPRQAELWRRVLVDAR